MLKIKDDIDLKELEKFWFYRMACSYCKNGSEAYICFINGDEIIVDIQSRQIHINANDCEPNELLETLYDLIKADMVEKVE